MRPSQYHNQHGKQDEKARSNTSLDYQYCRPLAS